MFDLARDDVSIQRNASDIKADCFDTDTGPVVASGVSAPVKTRSGGMDAGAIFEAMLRAQASLATQQFTAELLDCGAPDSAFAGIAGELRQAVMLRARMADHLPLDEATYNAELHRVIRERLSMPDVAAQQARVAELTVAAGGAVLAASPGRSVMLPEAFMGGLLTSSVMSLVADGIARVPTHISVSDGFNDGTNGGHCPGFGGDGPGDETFGGEPIGFRQDPPCLLIGNTSVKCVAECAPLDQPDKFSILGSGVYRGFRQAIMPYNLDNSREFIEDPANDRNGDDLDNGPVNFFLAEIPPGTANFTFSFAPFVSQKIQAASVEVGTEVTIRILQAALEAIQGNVVDALKALVGGGSRVDEAREALRKLLAQKESEQTIVDTFIISLTEALNDLFGRTSHTFTSFTVSGTTSRDPMTDAVEVKAMISGGSRKAQMPLLPRSGVVRETGRFTANNFRVAEKVLNEDGANYRLEPFFGIPREKPQLV